MEPRGAPDCPRCRGPMEPFSLERDVAIDLCPRCRAAWFDKGELARALHTHRDLRDLPPDELPLAAPDAPTCARCAGVCMLRVPWAVRGDAPMVDWCPQCEGVFTPLAGLQAMRALAHEGRRPSPGARAPAEPAPVRTQAPASGEPAALAFDPDLPLADALTPRQRAVMVPAALAAAAVLRALPLGGFLARGSRVWVHELGHAAVAWACGWRAVPLPMGFTATEPGRHLGVHAVVLGASAWGAWWSARRGMVTLSAALGFYALTALAWTWSTTLRTQEMLVSFGGCAGELVFGAALMVAATRDAPAWRRWARYRWVALGLGAVPLVDAAIFWHDAARDWNLIPWDSALADTGDMTALRDQHGWNELRITSRYVALARLCLAAVLAAWAVPVVALVRGRQRA